MDTSSLVKKAKVYRTALQIQGFWVKCSCEAASVINKVVADTIPNREHIPPLRFWNICTPCAVRKRPSPVNGGNEIDSFDVWECTDDMFFESLMLGLEVEKRDLFVGEELEIEDNPMNGRVRRP